MRQSDSKALCTIILAVVNIIVFFALSFQGMTEDGAFMLEHGAMYVPSVIYGGEYYRLVTSMFMHFGFQHLLNNMIMLIAVGWNLEREIGRIKFILIYFLSGLCGNVLSAMSDMYTQEFAISAGASGAIFGITGALIYIALCNHGRVGNVHGRGLIFSVALSLYLGFTSGGVDNLAHIGGLLSGFLLTAILYRKRQSEYCGNPWS